MKLLDILNEVELNECPAPTQNIALNLENRQNISFFLFDQCCKVANSKVKTSFTGVSRQLTIIHSLPFLLLLLSLTKLTSVTKLS